MNKVRSYISDSVVNKSLKVLVLRGAGVVLFFGLTLFLTNFFSSEQVGMYDFVRSGLLIFGGIGMLGTNQAIIYYSGVLKNADAMGSLKRIYLRMVAIVLSMSLLLLATYNLFTDAYFQDLLDKPNGGELVQQMVYGLFFFGLSMLNIDTIRAQGKPILSEFNRNIVRYTPFFIGAIALVSMDKTQLLVQAYLWGFVAVAFITSIQVWIGFTKLSGNHTERVGTKSILKRSTPMALSAVSFFMMQSVDIILLSKYLPFSDVAHYGVAVKLATTVSLVLISVNVIIAPQLAQFYAGEQWEDLKRTVRKGAQLILLISLPGLALMALLAGFILGLFGTEYQSAKEVLWILLGGQLINSICGPVAIYLNMTGKQMRLQFILLGGLLLNIFLNLWLIPIHGLIGAAMATAISMAAWNLVAVADVYRLDKVKTFYSV